MDRRGKEAGRSGGRRSAGQVGLGAGGRRAPAGHSLCKPAARRGRAGEGASESGGGQKRQRTGQKSHKTPTSGGEKSRPQREEGAYAAAGESSITLSFRRLGAPVKTLSASAGLVTRINSSFQLTAAAPSVSTSR